MSLYRKRDLGQASESVRKEIITRKKTLRNLRKNLREAISNQTRQKNLREQRKRKVETLDEVTRKKLMGKATSDLGRPEKYEKTELIEAICRIAISGSAAHNRLRTEVIRSVKDSRFKRFKIQNNLFNINRFTCIIFTKQINKHKYTTIIARRSHQ